jgi:hypothetical protein
VRAFDDMKPYAGAMRTHLGLLAAIIVVLAVEPLLSHASGGVAELADTTFGLLCLAAFLSLCRETWELRTGLLLFVPVLASDLAVYMLSGRGDRIAGVVFHGTLAAFLGFAVVVIVRLLARVSIIRLDDVIGAVVGYILAALAWSHVYGLAYAIAPGAFGVNPEIAPQLADWRLRRTLFNHLSFTTLTTIGYSDITPVGSPLYALVWIETIFGQFYMAVVVAQLVGLKLAQSVKGDVPVNTWAIVFLAVVAASDARAAGTRACSDPCLGAARAERTDCTASASGVFLDATAACVDRDLVCVEACRSERQDCRDATTLGADLARCALEQDRAQLDCRVHRPLRPRRFAICVSRERVNGFRCRRDAFRAERAALASCRTSFSGCADACAPGGPAGGRGACRAEGKAALQDALGECKLAYRATASACIGRDVGCVQECVNARRTCNAPARAALDAVLAGCTATRDGAVAACDPANPGGGTAREACVRAARAAASECRQTALDASLPSFASCTAAYAACLRACPAGATS